MNSLFRGMMSTPGGRIDGFFAQQARDVINLSDENTGSYEITVY